MEKPQETTSFLTSLRLKNPYKSLDVHIMDNEVQIDGKVIVSPEKTISICDFKLYARVIPFFDEKGELTGVERTFLGPNARQPSKEKWRTKLARGVTNGSSAFFYGSHNPEYKILGEGSENVLSALEVARKSLEAVRSLGLVMKDNESNCQFTAALGVSDLIKVPIEKSVHTILLITDIDGYNMETKQTLIDTVDAFLQRGLKVKMIFAPAGTLGKKRDLNDVIREEGLDAAKKIVLDPVNITSKEDLGAPNEILQLCLLSLQLKQKLENPSPSILFSLGDALAELKRFNQALDCYNQSLEGASDQLKVKIQHALGSVFLKKQDPERALDYYSQSLRGKLQLGYDPEDLEVLSSLEGIGKSYAQKKLFSLAASYFAGSFDAKIRRWKSDQHEGLSPLFLELGIVDFGQGNWGQALFHFKHALQLKSKESGRFNLNSAEILEKIGDTYYQQREYNEAIHQYKNAQEIMHKIFCNDRHGLDEEISLKIARAYCLLGLFGVALEHFRKSFYSQGKTISSPVLRLLLERAHRIELQTKETQSPEIPKSKNFPAPPPVPELSSTLSTALKINILRERSLRTRQVVLDLEMTGTGLKSDRITDIGCVVLSNFKKTEEIFQRYVNPGRPVRAEAYRLTSTLQLLAT